MVGHTIDAIEDALVVLAETIDVHKEVTFVFLIDDTCVVVRTEYDVNE